MRFVGVLEIIARPLSYLDLSSFDLGSSQHLDEFLVVHGVALGGAESEQDLILNFFQLLFHLSVADDQLVLGLLQVWTLHSHHLAQQLVLQTAENRDSESRTLVRIKFIN